MTISEIYQRFPITNQLQEHQRRAAAVGIILADHWTGKPVYKDTIIQTLLLHDMGNIVKFHFFSFLTPQEQNNVTYWQKAKEEFIEKYQDEHTATYAIAKELGVSNKVYYLLTHMGTSQLKTIVKENNWSLKIVSYADLRCMPMGVASINERFDDILKRYEGRRHIHANRDLVEEKRKYCLEVEIQLQKYISIPLSEITEKLVHPLMEQLSAYNLQVNS